MGCWTKVNVCVDSVGGSGSTGTGTSGSSGSGNSGAGK